MSLLLGLDLGSTSIKANIYDEKGNLVAGGSRPTILSHPDKEHPNWAIWHPEDVWNSVKESISGALKNISLKDDLRAISVTGFGMDGLPIDKNGKWLFPFISWHCPRTEKQSREWSQKVGSDKIFSITGKQVMPIDTVYRILWIKENHPEILEKTYKWLLIEDYINYLLCGEISTDYSMASSTSLLDQKTRNWSDELVKKADFDFSILPPVMPSGTVLGNILPEISRDTGLPESVKVVLGGHDYHCGALAVGAFKSEVVMDIIGTWEMVLQSTNKPKLENKVFKNGINVESHVVREMYDIVAYSVSGMMYEWLSNTLCAEEKIEAKNNSTSIWEIIRKKAAGAPVGSNGVFFAPYFFGAGTPYIDTRTLGAFLGLTSNSDKSNFIRSVIEGLNYNFRDMLEAFENSAGSEAEKIVAAGGAAQNEFWMQNKADIIGKTIEIPAIKEETPLGAALISGIGIGIYKNEEEAYKATYKVGKVYEPDLNNNSLYNDYYKIYKRLYPDLKEINNEIYEKFRK